MTAEFVVFVILATLIATASIGVVVSQAIVRSIVWLLLTLIGIAGLYFLLGAEFLGAAQLIVYVGGTMVLLIFGGMLTSGGPFHVLKTRFGDWFFGVLMTIGIFGLLALASLRLAAPGFSTPTAPLGVGEIGLAFLTTHLLPFEIVSIHLLVVLIGAAYFARAKKKATT
jgi:NADH-quinone oxidoreductase subunit J